jgi:hypothetical protein
VNLLTRGHCAALDLGYVLGILIARRRESRLS